MIGILIMTLLALVLSILLVFIDKKINKKSPSEIFLEYLPGYNCGMCGYAGCQGMSEKMVEDINEYKKCKLLRGEKIKKLEDFIIDFNKSK